MSIWDGLGQRGPELEAALLGADPRVDPQELHRVGKREIQEAVKRLKKYKDGKTNLEARIVEDELWYEGRHWEAIRRRVRPEVRGPEPTSEWLFNAILNKHADAMDNFPEPVVLPREASDEGSARLLCQVLPVVLEHNGFEQTYSGQWWEKLKHGTAAYGIFWNNQKDNGLGDVDVRGIDLLKLFWEPGISDIQDSRDLFLVDLVPEEDLDREYPALKGRLGGKTVDVKQYLYDDNVDTTGKSVVVDWYYKVRAASGRTVLQYAKFVGEELLFASENDPAYQETGWYEDGDYPVVLDTLYPEKGTPVGFGYVSVCKDPQLYIDKLSANILESSMMGTKKRFFASTSTAINKGQFLNWSEPIVDVEGELDDRRLREIQMDPVSPVYLNVLQMKVEEMKDTAANRDVNAGGTAGSGVTAAAAIAALQEAGNKTSRDMISASYRAYTEIVSKVIERMAQFYDEARTFRVSAPNGAGYQFVDMNNQGLGEQPAGTDAQGAPMFRKPVFDLKIKAQKKSPFSRMEQNERAKELYGMGFFNPDRAQEAMLALDMMEFEGIDKLREQVRQGNTLNNLLKQMAAQMDQMAAIIQALTGQDLGAGGAPAPGGGQAAGGAPSGPGADGKDKVASGIMQAQTPMTGYGERLAKRSSPSMEG